MKQSSICILLLFTSLLACNSQKREHSAMSINTVNTSLDTTQFMKTEVEWKKALTAEQYGVLREKGTDRPFTGKYYKTNDKGIYSCTACGNELFTSDMKFDSNCGWPSFDAALTGGKIKTSEDRSLGMVRTEILCAKCDGHLGHLFDDGPTKTGLRYCVNSTSLNFVKEK